jgi:hypothetical protein
MKSVAEKIVMFFYGILTASQLMASLKNQHGIDRVDEIDFEEVNFRLPEDIFLKEAGNGFQIVERDGCLSQAEEAKKEAILWQQDLLSEGDSLYCEISWPKGGTGTVYHSLPIDYLDGTSVPEKFHDYFYSLLGEIEVEDIVDGDYTIDLSTGRVKLL